jgi:hypothetical protein
MICVAFEKSFNFHRFNRVGRQLGLDHPADQKRLLFGQGFDRRPFGQQQFFGVQRVHGLRQSRFFKAACTFKKITVACSTT